MGSSLTLVTILIKCVTWQIAKVVLLDILPNWDIRRKLSKKIIQEPQLYLSTWVLKYMINYFVYKIILPCMPSNISNLKLVFHVPCDLSIFPWDCGWYGRDSIFWMPNFFKKVLTATLNSVLLSLWTLVGGPNVLMEKKYIRQDIMAKTCFTLHLITKI